MRNHQPNNAPASSSNIYLQFTSAKALTYTTLLHLHVHDSNSEPSQIIESLRTHLQTVKLDDDVTMIEGLVTSIISTLLASCDIMDNLNQQVYVAEQEEKCKVHVNSSKSCLDSMRSISMWLNLIFGRAKFVVGLISNQTDTKLGHLTEAIKRLGNSSFFLLVMKSLTRALNVILETTSRNTFSKSKALSSGYLGETFRSCLGAIRNSVALVHACRFGAAQVKQDESKTEWESAASEYIEFVVSDFLLLFIGLQLLLL